MDKTAIKNFAVRARKKLIEQVKQKAFEIGIDEDEIIQPQVEGEDSAKIYNRYLSKQELGQRDRLIREIESKGYEQVMEEVAYTWFNRFVALRFMEVNGYLPTGVRVLSSQEDGKVEPDIIKEALNVDLDIDHEKVYQFQDDNDIEGLYRYLLVKQCNSLNEIMPFIFEKIADYTEILLPDNLLSEGSVIRDMVESIEEKDWQQVEIIGWLYQYYISEKKDEVIQAKKKYKKEEIPYATQLFTPDWIVRYMVQNSLGRYWIESHPEDEELKNNWEFYIENPDPEPDIEEKLEPYIDRNMRIEDVTVFDPACGSGHILVYVFDVLYQIYERSGYLKEDIPRLIIENNLYGLEIDDRAYQLACLSVVMKALEYNKRFFEDIKDYGLELNIASIQETNDLTDEDIAYIAGEESGEVFDKVKTFINQFRDAKLYGSLIKCDNYNENLYSKLLKKIKEKPLENLFTYEKLRNILTILPKLIKQANIMEKTYDILVTNPPYMNRRYMPSKLKKFLNDQYEKVKTDLFSAFIDYGFSKVTKGGHLGFMTPFVWMFISSYKELRQTIVNKKTISSFIQLEYSGFTEATVPICTFTLRNIFSNMPGEYIKLSDFTGAANQPVKTIEAVNNPHVNYRYTSLSSKFNLIPDSPIAFWTSEKIRCIFRDEKKLKDFGRPMKGLDTCNNARFLRYWFEIINNKVNYNSNSCRETRTGHKWFPYIKGGPYRKWYGNREYVVNWENDGEILRNLRNSDGSMKSRPQNTSYYFKTGITWSSVSSGKFSVRCLNNAIFGGGGSALFVDEKYYLFFLSFLNSKIIENLMRILNPTLNFLVGDLLRLPVIIPKQDKLKKINTLANKCIQLSKTDWDSFETSWDFKKHPLLTHKKDANTIEEAFNNWSEFAEEQFYQLKENEEELNRIFIEIYGLEDELTPEVPEEDVTVRKADRGRDIRSFISYAVGCMFGRYSLDEEGLVYAGGEFDKSRYKTFPVDEDGIIPVLDDEYFDDDIVARFVEFVKVTFGEEHLEENLEYIADALIESGTSAQKTPRETIRRYFLYDFIKDHVSTYNKRPIYWLFQSDGRGKAFNALIYMHRYDKDTVARVRTDYLHELQKKIEAEKVRLQGIIDSDLSTREKNKAKKKLKKLEKDTKELREYDEKLNHLANQQIEIDLDDGVEVNYKKFANVLTNI